MAKRRAKRRVLIRRRRPSQKKQEAEVEEKTVTKAAVSSDEGDFGFIKGFEAGDFVSNEIESDFVSDNELVISDELFAEFEDAYGTNDELDAQAKRTTESVAKAIDGIDKL